MSQAFPAPMMTRLLRSAVDVVFPPQCGRCGALTDTHGQLCPSCWRDVHFLDGPSCACCGVPFEYDLGEGVLCGSCLARPKAYDRARAAFVYDEASRGLVTRLKYADRLDLVPACASWMARSGATLLSDADLIVPVPLHWRRLLRRRFNQSAQLAAHIARHADLPYVPNLLRRHRATAQQTRLTRRQRFQNVRGAFSVPDTGAVAGRAILLVDDVYTTGVTVEACARTLKRAGAARVDVLTLARVVLPDQI